jgi:hypothetical protein
MVMCLGALDALDDAMLRAVITRAQARLLDRPVPAGHTDELVVDIVDPAETLLLRDYRALDPTTQRQMRALVREQARVAAARHLVSAAVVTDAQDEEARSLMVDTGAEEISSAADGTMGHVQRSSAPGALPPT